MIRLQVALDFFELESALRVAKSLDDTNVDFIEAGTPLIHAWGLKKTLNALKEVTRKPIVADLKLVDVGFETAKLAFELGAQGVSVLAIAPQETLEAVKKARDEAGGFFIVDLIGCPDIRRCVEKAILADADYILFHLGIDVQKKLSLTSFLSQITEIIPRDKLALAGGISLQTLPDIAKARPALIIVGKAIAKADNPKSAANEFIRSLRLLEQ